MAKTKTVTVQIPKGFAPNLVAIEWGGVEITVKRTLSLTEMIEFVANVVESCFDDSGNFMPEIMDFAVKVNIATIYANIKLPKDIKKQYELLYISNITDSIVKQVNTQQLTEILNSISAKVKYKTDSRVNAAHAEIKKIAEGFSDTKSRLDNLMSFFSDMDVKDIVQKFANMDEKEFAREYASVLRNTPESSKPPIHLFGAPEADV